MAKKSEHPCKLVYISVLLPFLIAFAASFVLAQDQQKLLDEELLHQLFLSAKDTKTDRETLVKKINSVAKANFDQQYKGSVKDVELEGVYELAKNCYVTCHTAQLKTGEEVFLFHAYIFSKLENHYIQIHGRGKEDMAEFGKFMMMSESGKVKFIRYYFKTYAKVELPS